MAWLSAVPIDSEGKSMESRIKQIDKLAEINNIDPDYQLPEKGALEYLVNYLSEVGEAEVIGESIIQTKWQTLEAWARMTQTYLNPGELLAIMSLSAAYVNQYYISRDPACNAPHIKEAPSREVVAKKFESLFAMLRKS